MPFTPQATNLSFILLPSFPVYTIVICLMYVVPFTVPVMSISDVGALFVSPPSAPPFISVIFFFLSYSFASSLTYLLQLSPSCTALLSVYPSSFFPNPPMCFIGVCNSLPAHFSWLRCSTTLKYNIESVMQKHYRK